MALAGVGVDIVEISRMEKILSRTPRFALRVFTDEEREYCEHSTRPAAHYACRFAAREAVLKALGCGFGKGVRFDDVSVSRDAAGRPQAVLKGRAAEIAPKVDDARDPRRELAESFKEARSIIDELERVDNGR